MGSRVGTRCVVRINSKHFLGVSLTINGSVDSIGAGDDGEVVKFRVEDGSYRALKIFAEYTVDDYSRPAQNWIRQDQATREFTALSRIHANGRHPNFPLLYSTEVDDVTYTGLNGTVRGWAVQMELIHNQTNLRNSVRMWGLSVDKENVLYFDMELRGQIMNHVIRQLESVLIFLGECEIKHRDLDDCNVLVGCPDMHVYVVDFSRAKFSGAAGSVPKDPSLVLCAAHLGNAIGLTGSMDESQVRQIQTLYHSRYNNIYRSESVLDPDDTTGARDLIEGMVRQMNSMSSAVGTAVVHMYKGDPEKDALSCQGILDTLFEMEGIRLDKSMRLLLDRWGKSDLDDEESDEWDKQTITLPFECDFGESEITRMGQLLSHCKFVKFDDNEINTHLNTVVYINPSESYRAKYTMLRAVREKMRKRK
jgi:serine/threonine protein kinase